jgi:hypothetical protein
MADQLSLSGFRADAADKVIRLLSMLTAINADTWLRDRVCLHGGTAINLFTLDAPRLSVDIDLSYIGHADRDGMLAEHSDVEQEVINVGRQAGFTVAPGKPEHSGRKFLLHYEGSDGMDHVKVDLDYLNRSPLLPCHIKTIHLVDGSEIGFPVNADVELFAGKTKALAEGDAVLLRRVILYYLSISGPFPRPFRVADRFTGREHEVATVLYPMLLAGDEPTLDELTQTAEAYLADVSRPHDDFEAQYFSRAAHADFAPDLLFAEYPETLAAALVDPAAAWKRRNLAKAFHKEI